MTRLRVSGDIRVPGDKSISHRALLLAASAQGESRLRGLLPGEDCENTGAALRALGSRIPHLPRGGEEIRITSAGFGRWRSPDEPLDCGNSGTTARLMMGIVAGRPVTATFTGDASLRARPMRRVTEPLSRMGAVIRELAEPDRLPVEIRGGALQPISHRSPRASAQIKSALLLAGVAAGVPVEVIEPVRSRDHTERMLTAMRVPITESAVDDGWRVAIRPERVELPPLDLTVPGDPSSAAYLVALALLADHGELAIRGVGTNPTRTGFFEIVRRMGADLTMNDSRDEGGEPLADLSIRPGELRAVVVEGDIVPSMIDEIPVLAALATRAEGETIIRDAAELRTKESDRIAVLVQNLRSLGAEVEEQPDGLVIRGSDRPLRGSVRVHHDHRIAMSFAVLAALPGNEIVMDDPSVVAVSYPGFFETLRAITGQ